MTCTAHLKVVLNKIDDFYLYEVSPILSKSVSVVPFKLAPGRLLLIHQRENVQQYNEDLLNNEWQEEVTNAD